MSQLALEWLQAWYADHADGDWEHQNGVAITTLDNPGWSLRIDIEESELRDRAFDDVAVERSEHDWFHARVRDGKFEAFGGPGNLPELLACFQRWAEGQPRSEAA